MSEQNVDTLMRQLEDAMDASCDQPLNCDRMTLTRSWRGLLESFLTPSPSVGEPVAWRIRARGWCDGMTNFLTLDAKQARAHEEKFEVTPLYASPSGEGSKDSALTAAQIEAATRAYRILKTSSRNPTTEQGWRGDAVMILNAADAAMGAVADKEDSK